MKVLIGCPTYHKYEYCLKEYIDAIKALTYENFDLVLVDNSENDQYLEKIKSLGVTAIKGPYSANAKERIVNSREILRKKCLKEGYDFFFSLEQDVIVKPDTLKRLLAHNLPIVSCYYGNNLRVTAKDDKTGRECQAVINVPIIYLRTRPGFLKRANAKDIVHKGLIEVGAAGVGCMLISRKVLEQISFKLNPGKGFDDIPFCLEAEKKGYKIVVDGNIILPHLHKNWTSMGVK